MKPQISQKKLYVSLGSSINPIRFSQYSTNQKFEELQKPNGLVYFEINSLLKKYQSKLDNLDIVDELEFDKIEEGTVLKNIVTVLKHLNKMD